MATLVLTTVGGLVGGPLGAALGATIGQTVDRAVLFKPKGRQGPRLTELAVQTSSYGRQIPKLFGRMRVAGQVIWSTDLVEHQARQGGGKGQPSVTSYSYSVSFAVALSTRAIRDVGRIWADGNLLRGAAGDWKVRTGFRLHLGGEDQAPDALMTSAEGLGLAPAHRGTAYAVFEDLPLETFGNRIPSLTFEVIADDGPVAAGEIAREIGGGSIVAGDETMLIDGFSAHGDGARGVVEALADIAGGWFAPAAGGLALRTAAWPSRTIADEGRMRRIAAAGQAPNAVSVAHYDPARDWQIGVQQAVRPAERGGGATTVDLPAALSAGEAKAVAERMLTRAETGRVTRQVAADLALIDVAPGAVVAIAGEGGAWRVSAASLERHRVTLDLVALAPAPLGTPASPGRVLAPPDRPIGTTILHAFETPPLSDPPSATACVTVVAAGSGSGWRRAALQYSTDEGASWTPAGATGTPGTIGIVAAPFGSGPATLIDRQAVIDVTLAHERMALTNADSARLDRGGNLALVGDELLQFGSAVHLGGCDWRLSELWRGRRGTAPAAGAAGTRFVLIDEGASATIATHAPAGARMTILASGAGDLLPAEVDVVLSGASVLPPAPVQLSAQAGEFGLSILWRRRSRSDWRWRDGVDAALGEEREAYRVTVSGATGAVANFETAGPALIIPNADVPPTPVAVAVRQIGTNGPSLAAEITL